MKTIGSTKVVHDGDGYPWLVVGTELGYEAWRIEVTERHLFQRSWQASRFAGEQRTGLSIFLVEVEAHEGGE